MAIELTQYVQPKSRYGSMLPLAVLPPVLTSQFAAGAAAIELSDGTATIAILPDADIRVGVADTEAGAAAAAADATESVLCVADVLREFEVTGGHWLKTAAA